MGWSIYLAMSGSSRRSQPTRNITLRVVFFDAEMYQSTGSSCTTAPANTFYNVARSHHWAQSEDDAYSAGANELVIA